MLVLATSYHLSDNMDCYLFRIIFYNKIWIIDKIRRFDSYKWVFSTLVSTLNITIYYKLSFRTIFWIISHFLTTWKDNISNNIVPIWFLCNTINLKIDWFT